MELIDRDEVRFQMTKYGFKSPDMTIHEFVEDELKPVDAVPVVHGEWLAHNYGTTLDPYCVQYYCSKCNQPVEDYGPNYCPNCGARMDGGNNYGI